MRVLEREMRASSGYWLFSWIAVAAQACTTFGEISVASNGGGGASSDLGGGGGSDPANDPCTPGEERSCYSGPAETAYVGLCVPGKRICKLDGLGFGDCEGEVLPATETCSNLGDEDCDGLANEDGADCNCAPGTAIDCYSAAPATKDVGPCKAGTQSCNEAGNGYTACDGEITPKAETCGTSFDDDCDGSVNEEGDSCVCVPGTTEDCSDAPSGKAGVGACVMGSRACNSAGTEWGSCDGDVSPASGETCNNGKDDDCNGETDDGCTCTSGQTQSCYSGTDETKGVGSCKAGSQTCASNGTWGTCSGEVLPQIENCTTNADDDCDGTANESAAGCVCTPAETESCYTGPAGTVGVGVCEAGTRTCASTGKSWGPCDGQSLPASSEICDNGKDDNCAGGVDEGCSTCTPGTWVLDPNAPGGFLAIDSQGTQHIVQASSDLNYYTKPMGGSWSVGVLIDSQANAVSPLKVDSSLGLHVSYYDPLQNGVVAAHLPFGGSWTTSLVETGADLSAIAPNTGGNPFVAYYDKVNFRLRFAVKSTSWTRETVDDTANVGSNPSIAVDSGHTAHISYYDQTNGDLKYAKKPFLGSWALSTIDSAGNVGWHTATAVDSTGGVHIVYQDVTNKALKYAFKDGPTLDVSTLDASGDVGGCTSIAIDSADGLHISFCDAGGSRLRYGYKAKGASWTFETIYFGPPASNPIAVDPEGNPHVAGADRCPTN